MMNKTAPKQQVKQAVRDLRKQLDKQGITPKPGKNTTPPYYPIDPEPIELKPGDKDPFTGKIIPGYDMPPPAPKPGTSASPAPEGPNRKSNEVAKQLQATQAAMGTGNPTSIAAKADVAAKMAESRAPQMPSPGMGASAPNAAKADVAAKMAESRAPQMPSPGGAPMTIPKAPSQSMAMRKGGAVRSKPQTKFASGGSVGSASKRGDGIAQRGKTKGRMC
jgi:hypothetical protein